MTALDRIRAYRAALTATQQDIHANPEIGLPTRASDIVAKQLGALGIEVHRGIDGTGVVGMLAGQRAGVDRAARRHGCAAYPRGERLPSSRPSRA